MSGPFVDNSDSKLAPAPTTITQPPPGYQSPQSTLYVQQQQPSVMANQLPMLQPQGTGATLQNYPLQPTQAMLQPQGAGATLQTYPLRPTQPMLQPQGTGATLQTYPLQPTQPMNPMNPYSPTQPAMQLYPPMQQNPALMQNPAMMQQPQYMQAPLTPAQAGELYRSQCTSLFLNLRKKRPLQLAVYARCANGQHEWTTTYGPAGIITAIVYSIITPPIPYLLTTAYLDLLSDRVARTLVRLLRLSPGCTPANTLTG